MAAAPITTHVADADARLLSVVRNMPTVRSMLATLVEQLQEIEDVTLPLQRGLSLAEMEGQALDDYGSLVGVPRNGLDDESYRALIKGTIGSNYSDGTGPVLMDALAQLFQAAALFRKDPNAQGSAASNAPGRNTVAFGIGSPNLPKNLYPLAISTFQNALSAGSMLYYLSRFDAGGAFAAAGPAPWVRGFGDVSNPATGGKMADLLFNNSTV